MTAAAGARRSSTALKRFVDFTRPGDLLVVPLAPVDMTSIERLPHVAAAEEVTYIGMAAAGPDGGVDQDAVGDINSFLRVPRVGNADAVYRPLILAGRDLDPAAPHETIVNEELASLRHVGVGSTIRMVAFGPDQLEDLLDGGDPTGPVIDFTVVGIVRHPEDVVPRESEYGAAYGGTQQIELTPAFGARYGDRVARYDPPGGPAQSMLLRHGLADVEAFRTAVRGLPGGEEVQIAVGDSDAHTAAAKAERATDIEAVALLALALVLILATFVLVGQGMVRLARSASTDVETLRAIGLGPRDLAVVAAFPGLVAAAAGVLAALVVAVAASPLTPIGLARSAEVDPGARVDALVLGAGGLVTLLVLSIGALGTGWLVQRSATARRQESATRPGRLADRVAALGAPFGLVVGVRLATGSGRNDRAAPVRTAVVAGATGLVALTAVLTFTASLDRLRNDDAAQGWTWDLKIGNPNLSDYGAEEAAALAADPAVAGYVPVADTQVSVSVDGLPVGLGGVGKRHGDEGLQVVTGRLPADDGEVVLGTRTARRLGLGIGDRTALSVEGDTLPMRVVGTALLNPALASLMTIGDGALVTIEQAAVMVSDFRQNGFLVELTPGTSVVEAERAFVDRWGGVVQRALTPDDVTNVARVRSLPNVLAVLVGLVAIAMVGLALVVTVRERRRELAVLRAIGATRRQLGSALRWQGAVLFGTAAVIGVPVGVVAGRLGWQAVAEGLGVLTPSRVPVPATMALVASGLVAVLIVSALPTRLAARVTVAAGLRGEDVPQRRHG